MPENEVPAADVVVPGAALADCAPLAAQVGVIARFDLLMVLVESAKFVAVAVKDQPVVPPRASVTVMLFRKAVAVPGVTADVSEPKFTMVLLGLATP